MLEGFLWRLVWRQTLPCRQSLRPSLADLVTGITSGVKQAQNAEQRPLYIKQAQNAEQKPLYVKQALPYTEQALFYKE